MPSSLPHFRFPCENEAGGAGQTEQIPHELNADIRRVASLADDDRSDDSPCDWQPPIYLSLSPPNQEEKSHHPYPT
jgi:hypothetical protein